MLGLFVAIRALHLAKVREMRSAEADLLLARHLFPRSRLLYSAQMEVSVECGQDLFGWGEDGHPANVGARLREWRRARDCEHNLFTTITTETNYAKDHDALRNQRIATRW